MFPMFPMFYPKLNSFDMRPMTLYSLMNSIVNYGKEEKTNIYNISKEARKTIFDFNYPLTDKINKEQFEEMILNHFMMRRIGFETPTQFKLQLSVKMNEIMPLYNKMIDSFDNWNIFKDGEIITRTSKDDFSNNQNKTDTISQNKNDINKVSSQDTTNSSTSLTNNSTTNTNNISDRRNSELPQNEIEDVQDGSYLTNYNYDTESNSGTDVSTSNGTNSGTNNSNIDTTNNSVLNSTNNSNLQENNVRNILEIIEKSPADKIKIFKEFQENTKNIYSMIFKDLECLFYQLD